MRLGSVAQLLGGPWPENSQADLAPTTGQNSVLDKLMNCNRSLRQVRGRIEDHLNYIQSKLG